jgi:hypothetical protein
MFRLDYWDINKDEMHQVAFGEEASQEVAFEMFSDMVTKWGDSWEWAELWKLPKEKEQLLKVWRAPERPSEAPKELGVSLRAQLLEIEEDVDRLSKKVAKVLSDYK